MAYDFQTKRKGIIQLKFFEYSISKRVHVQPDVVYYEETMEKPVFDLILGTKTMNELGIVLNFKQNTITIDEIELPMTSITNMPTSKIKKALTLNNSLAKVQEPKSTEEATSRVVRILDANYKKANLPEIVKTCSHLNPNEQDMLLEVLTEYEQFLMGPWVPGKLRQSPLS